MNPIAGMCEFVKAGAEPPVGGGGYWFVVEAPVPEIPVPSPSFGGSYASTITAAGYHFAWYEPKVGQFVLKTTSNGQVFSIDPTSFDVREIATIGSESMPAAMNGVQTRWQRLPNLGGYAFYPRHGSGIWFLAID